MAVATVDKDMLSTGDVARLYGVSAMTIRRWIKLGLIEYVEVGNTHLRRRRTIRISKEEAEKHFKTVPAEFEAT